MKKTYNLTEDYSEIEIVRNNARIGPEFIPVPKRIPHFLYKLNVDKKSKIIIIGDIHSSLASLREILFALKRDSILLENFQLNPNYYLIFLGDILDRGNYSLECLFVVLQLKLKNMENCIIIKGNHETSEVYGLYGFWQEYNYEINELGVKNPITSQVNSVNELKRNIMEFIHINPVALFLHFDGDVDENGTKNYYQLCHGGFSELIFTIEATDYDDDKKKYFYEFETVFDEMEREVPIINKKSEHFIGLSKYLENDEFILNITSDIADGYLWNDFSCNATILEWNTVRGSYILGAYSLDVYLRQFNIHCIISGHQDIINSGFIFDPDSFLNYSTSKSKKDGKKYIPSQRPDYNTDKMLLYEPDYRQGQNQELEYDIRNANITENREHCILGVITSTCNEAKGMKYDHYLELEV